MIGQIIVMVFDQRRTQVYGSAGLPEIVGERRNNRALDVLLNAVQRFLIALVPTIDDYPNLIRINSQAFQRR